MPEKILKKHSCNRWAAAVVSVAFIGAFLLAGCGRVSYMIGEWQGDVFEWYIDEKAFPDGKVTDDARCVFATVKRMDEVAGSIGNYRRPYGEAVKKLVDDKCPRDFNAAVHKYADEIIDKNGHDDFFKITEPAYKYGVKWEKRKK